MGGALVLIIALGIAGALAIAEQLFGDRNDD
jgi:hypothetical protein